MAKNRLEKFGIKTCTVSLSWESTAPHQDVRVTLKTDDGVYSDTVLSVVFQRASVSLHRNMICTDGVWERHYVVQQAEECGATRWDVGPGPYGLPYAGRLDSNEIAKIHTASAILKALGWDDGNDADALLAAVEKAGVPVTWLYHGYTADYERAYDVPDGYRDHAALFARSPEALEAKAAYLNRQAQEARKWEQERAERAAAEAAA